MNAGPLVSKFNRKHLRLELILFLLFALSFVSMYVTHSKPSLVAKLVLAGIAFLVALCVWAFRRQKVNKKKRKHPFQSASSSVSLCCEKLDEFLYCGMKPVGVLATGCREVRLTTAAALHQLGSLADVLADVNACSDC